LKIIFAVSVMVGNCEMMNLAVNLQLFAFLNKKLTTCELSGTSKKAFPQLGIPALTSVRLLERE
jgi:hypothetical protein